MLVNITKGSGISGAIAYVMGEGTDPLTGKRILLPDGQISRAQVLGGQNFGYDIETPEDVELARKVMEWMAKPENQAGRTRKCEKDCMHISLSWHKGYQPSSEEMIEASQGALRAIGMEDARAIFVKHHETEHAHVHIVASRINPLTGMTFKDGMDKTILHTWALRWEREHNQISKGRRQLHALIDAIEARDIDQTIDRLTKRESVFSRHDLDKYMIYAGFDREARKDFGLRIISNDRIVPLREQADKAVTHFTTREVLAAERDLQRNAAIMADDLTHGMGADRIDKLAAKYELDREQKSALDWAGGLSGFAIINGQAGTGKSRVLKALSEGYHAAGYNVIGMAWTNQVVADMKQEGYQNTSTIDAEFMRLQHGRSSWNQRTVLVVDEAAMISTEKLSELFTKAQEAQAKVILAGDPQQLGSIEKGGMFEPLQNEHGAAVLRDVKRVKDQDQKQAFNAMHDRDFGAAMKVFENQNAIQWSPNKQQSQRSLADQYMSDHSQDPDKSRFVFAATNELADQLNQQIRDFRKQRGELGAEHTIKTANGAKTFAINDRIQFTANAYAKVDKQNGLVNGYAGVITNIQHGKDDRDRLTVELDHAGGPKPKPLIITVGDNHRLGQFNGIKLGYAGTVYRGQGRTLDQTYVLHSVHLREASGYVALTRHREKTTIFASHDVAKDTAELVRQLSRTEKKRAANSYHIDDSTKRHAMGSNKPEKVFAYDPQLGSREVHPDAATDQDRRRTAAKTPAQNLKRSSTNADSRWYYNVFGGVQSRIQKTLRAINSTAQRVDTHIRAEQEQATKSSQEFLRTVGRSQTESERSLNPAGNDYSSLVTQSKIDQARMEYVRQHGKEPTRDQQASQSYQQGQGRQR